MKHERVEIVKCLCGHSSCNKYSLSNGSFYQGCGWDKETAERIAACWNATLSMSTKTLQDDGDDWIHSYIANADLTEAIDRLEDMYKGDDGQAWKEAERFLRKVGRPQ